MKKLC